MSDEDIYQTASEALKAIPGFVKIETVPNGYDLCFEFKCERNGREIAIIARVDSLENIAGDIYRIGYIVDVKRAELEARI